MTKPTFMSTFNNKKLVFGMLHLKGDTPDQVVERALLESHLMIDNGVDAVIVENYFGTVENVQQVLHRFQRDKVDFIYGINVLDDDAENFRTAVKYNAAFLQLDSVVGHLTPNQDEEFDSFIESCRASYNGYVVGGVRFKYQPYNSGRTLAEDLRIGMTRCDAIAVTGEGTGIQTPMEKIVEFRDIIGPDFPLVIAAGALPESCAEHFKYAGAAIVGSYFKDTYQDTGDVDAAHVCTFMDAVRRCR